MLQKRVRIMERDERHYRHFPKKDREKELNDYFLKNIKREHLIANISKLLEEAGLSTTEVEVLADKISTYLAKIGK